MKSRRDREGICNETLNVGVDMYIGGGILGTIVLILIILFLLKRI